MFSFQFHSLITKILPHIKICKCWIFCFKPHWIKEAFYIFLTLVTPLHAYMSKTFFNVFKLCLNVSLSFPDVIETFSELNYIMHNMK